MDRLRGASATRSGVPAPRPRPARIWPIGLGSAALGSTALFFLAAACAVRPAIVLVPDAPAGRLSIFVAGREALVYQHSEALDLPHYWPLRSPSGKNLLVQKTEPYPHHRSFWFADTVRLEGEREVSLYSALYTGLKTETAAAEAGKPTPAYGPPFSDRIRHRSFSRIEAGRRSAVVEAELVWEMDGGRPILDEKRRLAVHDLGRGEYLLDIAWTLTAAHGDIRFVSDDVHYAWPYLRLDPAFSGDSGGKIVSATGASGENATNMMPARWIDYSNTVEGITEGIAVFQRPDGREHRWLTREYGTFGPRRPDELSGKPFILKKGESMSQRVGVLVHRGDVLGGRVRERYEHYVVGQWGK